MREISEAVRDMAKIELQPGVKQAVEGLAGQVIHRG